VAQSLTQSVLLAAERAFDRQEVSTRSKSWWSPQLSALFSLKTEAYRAHQIAVLDRTLADHKRDEAKERLRVASRRFSHAAARARQTDLDERLSTIENLYTDTMTNAQRPNHALYWRKVKQSMGRSSTLPATLHAADGSVLVDKADKIARWKEFYEEGAADHQETDEERAHGDAVRADVARVAAARAFLADLCGLQPKPVGGRGRGGETSPLNFWFSNFVKRVKKGEYVGLHVM
jgi:hypothetical protein